MGWDGVRIDAVKHFPAYATEDFLWNLQNNAVWASGSNDMFAVGEYVGNMAELDNWCGAVQNRAGTFDFSLRFALQDIITQGGNYNLGSLPAAQQQNRLRTVPFVNNHDTYRPQVGANGNITGWNTGSQIGQQIEIVDPRASVAYAIALAVDGAPEIFFEDLFNIGYLGNRFNHDPKDTTELPTHSDVENLIWCHQNLHFKDGAYFVRWQAQDALVIERGAKALIAVNDHYSSWQNLTNVSTSFPAGTVLKDYSGANGNATVVVNGAGQVNISIPPCDGSAAEGRRGYSVWAPVGVTTNYVRPSESITQEWEMANDLGDSHASSLQQGGALPDNSTDCRVVGRVFPDSSSTLTVNIYPENPDASITLEVLNAQCEVIDTISAFGTLNYTHTAAYAGWHTLRIRNSSAVQPGQRCWVKANYTAPLSVNTAVAKLKCACTLTGLGMEALEEAMFELYPNPFNDQLELTIIGHSNAVKAITVYQANGTQVYFRTVDGVSSLNVDTRSWAKGLYFIELETEKGRARTKVMKQ